MIEYKIPAVGPVFEVMERTKKASQWVKSQGPYTTSRKLFKILNDGTKELLVDGTAAEVSMYLDECYDGHFVTEYTITSPGHQYKIMNGYIKSLSGGLQRESYEFNDSVIIFEDDRDAVLFKLSL